MREDLVWLELATGMHCLHYTKLSFDMWKYNLIFPIHFAVELRLLRDDDDDREMIKVEVCRKIKNREMIKINMYDT